MELDAGNDQPKRRNEQLDMLRGIAIGLVLCHHMYELPEGVKSSWLGIPVEFVKNAGWMGVDLFFVLSGFLVSGLIFSEVETTGSFRPVRFLVRRGFKIYPSYYAMVALSFLVIPKQFLDEQTIAFAKTLLLFVQNYFLYLLTNVSNPLWLHTWSLAVEEHFYFGLSLVAVLLLRGQGNLKSVPYVCIGICLIVLGLRANTFAHPPTYPGFADYATHLRIDALTFGVLLAFLYHHQRAKLERFVSGHARSIVAVAILFLIPCVTWGYHGLFTYVFGLSLLYLGFGALLLVAVIVPRTNLLTKMLASVGFYSYSIYLWHRLVLLILEGLSRIVGMPYAVKLAAYFVFAILIGAVFSKLVEIPFLAWRERVCPARPKQAAIEAKS